MSDPAYRINDFFYKMSNIKSTDEFQVFMRQYWYVWLIISIIIVIMVIINVLMIVYFRRRSRTFKRSDYLKPGFEEMSSKTIMIPEKVKDNVLVEDAISEDTDAQFAMEALISNNKYRALHNCPPLKYNENLAKIAQSWADTLGRMQKLQHSPNHWRRFKNVLLGENLCYVYNMRLTGERMMDTWYSESKKHNFTLDRQQDTQNFSQMVWKGSKEVGFGRIKGENGEWWYGVAMYMPSGNIVGHFAENVPPPSI